MTKHTVTKVRKSCSSPVYQESTFLMNKTGVHIVQITQVKNSPLTSLKSLPPITESLSIPQYKNLNMGIFPQKQSINIILRKGPN